jgi:HPt (histidine-containing phosphotransfer) domain-containing protein
MVALLEGRCHDVFHALDADQAIEALQVQHFGLIVCDPSVSFDRLHWHPEDQHSGWLVELHDSDAEPCLQWRSNGASSAAVIAGLGNLERVTDLIDRLLAGPGGFASKSPPPPAPSLPVLDRKRFCAQMNNDPAMMLEIIDLYIGETEKQLIELADVLRRQDCLRAGRLAHTLKGSFSAVFASRAGALAKQLEIALNEGDLNLAMALLDPLMESSV